MLWSTAWAQAGGAAQPSMLEQFLPIIALIAIFYFFIIRPQSKRAKQHGDFLSALKRGDEVVTNGGIFGRVEGITDSFVTLEVADDVKIRVLKSQVLTSAKETANQKS